MWTKSGINFKKKRNQREKNLRFKFGINLWIWRLKKHVLYFILKYQNKYDIQEIEIHGRRTAVQTEIIFIELRNIYDAKNTI